MRITLEGLVDTKVDADILKLAPDFIRNRQQDLKVIKSAYEQKDYDTIASICHKLKGFATPFGFTNLEVLAANLEDASKARNQEALNPHYSQIEVYINEKNEQLLKLKS